GSDSGAQRHMAAALVFRLHDRGPELVREVLLERGWEEYDSQDHEDQDWNLYWRGSTFSSLEYRNLLPWQRLNHHPKTVGITRKDFLVRNLRRMRATCGSSLYDFSPTAFILPNDYTRFLAEHENLHLSRERSAYWICKPVDLSRGRGIFIFQDLKDLVYDGPVILQRYISDPLLVSGYKFDLRIYVCVKSFHPLTVYIHQEGLVRFATEKYDLSSLRNLYAHLTNTSINKLGPFYTAYKERVGPGCKWTMNRFRHFLQSQDVNELLLWQRINNIVTLTLLTIAPSVPLCANCVELFGFDVLIDGRFKPWLLEVNYSPALTLDCQADFVVKKALVSDLIDLMNYSASDSLRQRKMTGTDQRLGPGPLPRPRLLPPVDLNRTHNDQQVRPVGYRFSHRSWRVLKSQNIKPTLSLIYSSMETEAPSDRTTGLREQHVPPVRVGDFIRTFPFNRATRKASQHTLDVKKVLQELQRLTNQLVPGQSEKTSSRRTEEELKKKSEGGEKFESLFWGLKDPPFIRPSLKRKENSD
uniref:Tubulin tyrosine ligase-like family, member 2 n=1 Tax=Cynoglossus semilaevis TaxID=244447 RepID=A0A3P8V296_CYNSE